MKTIKLKGITWNHSRGFVSIIAAAQRFEELNPGVEIKWEKRSLQEFADKPVDKLAESYDLLIIDHPWTGFAARNGFLLPMDDWLSKDFLEDQAKNSVGQSYTSYNFNDKQWALAIDAATPVAAARDDILSGRGFGLPSDWHDLIKLAEAGLVAVPGIPQDMLMNFYMLCCTLGEAPCGTDKKVVSKETGTEALSLLKDFYSLLDPACFAWNPIKVFEAMSSSDRYAYCPFAYGYSNYSRRGYAANILTFHNTVKLDNGAPLQTTLGGTGLAVSTACKHPETAMNFARFTAAPETQRTIFFDNGGQPGHRSAWLDEHTNAMSAGFFKNTLLTLDNAFLRPRYAGHMYFQDRAGRPICDYLRGDGSAADLLKKLNIIYSESKELN